MAQSHNESAREDWWRNAIIYQIYIRSFADGDGDRVGDIAGIRSRLPYLNSLGVDAIWITPWYPSPMADGGYDVSDFRDIDPRFGTLAEATTLIEEAHAAGLRVLLDLVPNHTSNQHPWFQAALAAPPGSPERDRYIFRRGLGAGGERPPNDWRSVFGGPAWSPVSDGWWYLHLFAPEQPDLNWQDASVQAEFDNILRFWFDRGVDGFRIDVAHGLAKDPALPDLGDPALWPDTEPPLLTHDEEHLLDAPNRAAHPHWDRDEVHSIYEEWRKIADSYDPPRIFVAEAWLDRPSRLARYVSPGRLHTAFNFEFLRAPWAAGAMSRTIKKSLSVLHAVGAPATWVLSNHDVERHVTRYGRRMTHAPRRGRQENPGAPDDWLGLRRARAAALLMLALPGGAYVYQGEELGLPEVLDLPDDALRDPIWERSGHTERGRDGSRVPLPWTRTGSSYGFGRDGSWLPQPPRWSALSVEAQEGHPRSTLRLYREALAIRRRHPALGAGSEAATNTRAEADSETPEPTRSADLATAAGPEMVPPVQWLDLGDDVVAFRREPGFVCVVNLGNVPIRLPAGTTLLSSDAAGVEPPDGRDGVDRWLAPDTAVWLGDVELL